MKTVAFYENVDALDIRGVDCQEPGRISLEALRPYLPAGEADFYYCGPVGFITAVENLLNKLKVHPARRHSEAFAPDPSFITELVGLKESPPPHSQKKRSAPRPCALLISNRAELQAINIAGPRRP